MSSSIKPVLGSQLELGHPLAKGLMAYWLKNEGTGIKAYDSSGNRHTGTFGAGAASPSWVGGQYGPVISFDGGDIINLAGFTPSAQAALSFSCWFRSTGTSLAALFSWGSGVDAQQGVFFGIDPDPGTMFALIGGYDDAAIGYACNDDVWRHFAVTWDGITIVYYMNSIPIGTDPQAGPVTPSAATATIGKADGIAAYAFTGSIDVPTLWNRALSASEIAQLYREPFAMFDSNPIVLWTGAMAAVAAGNVGIMTTNPGFWGATY